MTLLADRIELAIAHWEHIHNKKFVNADMARRIGVSRATVGDWRKGRTKKQTGENLLGAANYLGVDGIWLSSGKGQMIPFSKDGAKPPSEVINDTAGIYRAIESTDALTPTSRAALLEIQNAAASGLLTDADVKLLKIIVDRLIKIT